MAGIYIHIPFCKQACHYCNFHFSTSLRMKGRMLDAILAELNLRGDYLQGETVETIYFGGGTPSLLETGEIIRIIEHIQSKHRLGENPEITLEANPDDLTPEKTKALADTPVNRLSIGIQSFFDEDLKYMNRAHNAQEATHCISLAQAAGFHDISIDLIYGSPTTTDEVWQQNLDRAFGLGVPHISSYCMTVEEGTALHHFVKAGKAAPVDEERAARQFNMLMEQAAKAGYEHYEISNFALPGRYSRHNTAYWQGVHYLGLGPSAHSFDGKERQWNIAHNPRYIKALLEEGRLPSESEILSPADRYNEYVMTGLRTQWGCHSERMEASFRDFFLAETRKFLADGIMTQAGSRFFLSNRGKLLADRIAMELFWDE